MKYDKIRVMNIFGGRRAQEAKELTAEIDRETDAESLKEQARAEAAKTEIDELEQGNKLGWQAGEVSAETRSLGSAALERAVIASKETIKEQVAVENGYVDTGLETGRNVIGGESEKQIKERLKDDLEDAKMEEKVDLPPELLGQAELLEKGQESLTRGAIAAIDDIVRRREVKPADLERQVSLMRTKMLATYGRKLGERN